MAPLRLLVMCFAVLASAAPGDEASLPRASEAERVAVIAQACRSVVCIFDPSGTSGGAGVVISPDGLGLTNYHVIAELLRSRRGMGAMADGRKYPLEILGIDPTGDVAMFRLTGRDSFDAAPLGDSDALQVGDPVFAAGNPFLLAEDYTPTVTAGIVSGLARYQAGADPRSLVYTDCIQIDASINPGNSGGPLFDQRGRIIGINGRASFQRRGRVNVGLAYAISIDQIRRFIPALSRGLLVEHGSLGATVIDAGFRRVVFDKVLEEASAWQAGVRPGDRAIEFEGRPITSANALQNVLGAYPAGWPVSLVWEHEGERIEKDVVLGRLTAQVPPQIRSMFKSDDTVTRAASSQPSSFPVAEPAMPEADDPVAGQALAATVQLYGAAIGSESGYGSGVIVSPEGHVVTVLSLLLEAQRLRAVTRDGHVWRCEVVYRDERRQLALLKMAGQPENRDTLAPLKEQLTSVRRDLLVPVEDAPLAGDRVFVVGNPFKVAQGDEPLTVMGGVVAGRCRFDALRGSQPCAYRGEVLLLDAITSNPGSPGSAVVDEEGRWVGLVGEIVTSRLTNTYLNYAYPAAEVLAFLNEARASGTSTTRPASVPAAATGPGYHGIRLSRIAYRRELPFVRSVVPGSPAEQAGLKPDDLILSANGVAVAQSRVFEEMCDRLHPGDELSLTVKRGEVLVTTRFTLTEPPK